MNGRTAVRVGSAGAAAAGLLAAGLAATVGAAGPASAATAVHLVLQAVQTQHRETDIGPKDTSIGDRQVFAERLYKSGKKVGTDGVECVITHVTRKDGKVTAADSQCVGTLRLGRGQVAVQGLLSFDAAAPKPFKLVINGGTGFYEGATGEMLVESTGETKSNLTLDMTVG